MTDTSAHPSSVLPNRSMLPNSCIRTANTKRLWVPCFAVFKSSMLPRFLSVKNGPNTTTKMRKGEKRQNVLDALEHSRKPKYTK
jgi:hypothetical protein